MAATAVILAAGLGTRMRSPIPKALHAIGGKSMLRHVVESAEMVFDRVVVVVGPEMEEVSAAAAPHPSVVQLERRGTAHAALQAIPLFGEGDVAVLYADNPLIQPETMRAMIQHRRSADASLAMLAMYPEEPGRYGRVVEHGGRVQRIVEFADADEEERSIVLCNAGVICARSSDLSRWLSAVGNDNAQGEFYLTDVVGMAAAEGGVIAHVAPEHELRGVNTPEDLAAAELSLRQRLFAPLT